LCTQRLIGRAARSPGSRRAGIAEREGQAVGLTAPDAGWRTQDADVGAAMPSPYSAAGDLGAGAAQLEGGGRGLGPGRRLGELAHQRVGLEAFAAVEDVPAGGAVGGLPDAAEVIGAGAQRIGRAIAALRDDDGGDRERRRLQKPASRRSA
jgi:hypothetical protein